MTYIYFMELESIERPIVPSHEWNELNLEELLNQKNILFDRWEFLVAKGYPYATNLLEALHKIDDVIQTKLNPVS